jgi:hypothetical protein
LRDGRDLHASVGFGEREESVDLWGPRTTRKLMRLALARSAAATMTARTAVHEGQPAQVDADRFSAVLGGPEGLIEFRRGVQVELSGDR